MPIGRISVSSFFNMKARESNIELLRIITMLLIVLLHANYFSLGPPSQEATIYSPVSSFLRVFAEQICIVGVDVFVMISGWFGIKPSFKGMCSLLYQVLFWGVIFTFVGFVLHSTVSIESLVMVVWFGSAYWFIVSYIGLYVISPILNTFVRESSQKRFLFLLLVFFATEFIYGWVADSDSFNGGYSIISFVGLYLLARYLRLYSVKLRSIKPTTAIIMFLICSLIPAVYSFLGFRNGWLQLRCISYISPLVIASSVFLFFFFTKLEFRSRAINWIACSVLSVYLVHQHPVVIPYFQSYVQMLATSGYSTSICVTIILLSTVLLFIFCVAFDRIRISSWRVIGNLFFDRLIDRIEQASRRIISKWTT